ncbi:MAG: hypothetical protein R3E13_02630 [Alphaproteobacteria bacterium]
MEKEPSFIVALGVWWAWVWRAMLLALLAGFVAGFVFGFLRAVTGVEALSVIGPIIGGIGGVFVGIWILQRLMLKGTKTWRLAVIEKQDA